MNNPYNFAIYNWHIELSSKCSLKCPRCQRTEEPHSFQPKQMNLRFIKKIFSRELMSQIMRITFSGNFGDPIYNTELIKIVDYLKVQNPSFQLVIVTNGSYKTQSWWKDLAQYLTPVDEIIFSIDGWNQESNQKYRINSDWESILTGVKEMVKSKAFVRWSTIIFKHNLHNIGGIRQLAQKIGVDSFAIVLSERFGSYQNVYLNSEGVDPLEPDKHLISDFLRPERYKHIFNKSKAMSEFYKKFNVIFKKNYDETKLNYKNSEILPSCKYGYRGVYVDVNGIFSPCCWVGSPYKAKESPLVRGKIHKYSECVEPYLEELNLHRHSLDSVLSNKLWNWLEKGWRNKGMAYVVCEKKCLKSYTDKAPTNPLPIISRFC